MGMARMIGIAGLFGLGLLTIIYTFLTHGTSEPGQLAGGSAMVLFATIMMRVARRDDAPEPRADDDTSDDDTPRDN